MRSKTIRVDYLTRVEGEGGIRIELRGDSAADVKLRIFEPPRLFEALLRGRDYREAPDITARICGICPVAHATSAVHAMEDACGTKVGKTIEDLRRLLYCGEWIESHALHIYLLHAPDFLGYPDAISAGKDHPDIVRRGLKLKKVGNDIVSLLGGREIHPVNVRIGGFYRVFSRKDFEPLIEPLKWAIDAAIETVRWTAAFTFPDFERDYEFVSLRHPGEYPLSGVELVSNKGLQISVRDYEANFTEEQVSHSHALQSARPGHEGYSVGPLARYNLNFDRLSPLAQEVARSVGLSPPCRNPFRTITVRSVEILHACEETLRIIDSYEPPGTAAVEAQPRAATGCAITEAPRGILYHRYQIDEEGVILQAKIVPPTAQNQKAIEADLRMLVKGSRGIPKDELTLLCEQCVRSYDPCISCATHLVKEMGR